MFRVTDETLRLQLKFKLLNCSGSRPPVINYIELWGEVKVLSYYDTEQYRGRAIDQE